MSSMIQSSTVDLTLDHHATVARVSAHYYPASPRVLLALDTGAATTMLQFDEHSARQLIAALGDSLNALEDAQAVAA